MFLQDALGSKGHGAETHKPEVSGSIPLPATN